MFYLTMLSTAIEYTASLNMNTVDDVGPADISTQQHLYSISHVHTREYENFSCGCFNLFCSMWVCVSVGFVMCGCVYVWVL